MLVTGHSVKKGASRCSETITKRRLAAVIGVIIVLVGLILMPVSKISETDRVSTPETQPVTQNLCPPPIVAFLESGGCHITIIEHLPNLTSGARIVVLDENNSVVYQSSVFEEAPYVVRRDFNFMVNDSGIYNMTLEDAGVFFVKVEMIATKWENVVTYPFESLFYYGLIIAAVGLCAVSVSFAIERRTRNS